MAFVGPDASGKTTLARRLLDHLKTRGVPVHYVHFWTLAFPFSLAARWARKTEGQAAPRHSRPSSWRLMVLGLNTVLINYGRLLPRCVRRGIVICDRSPYDIIVYLRAIDTLVSRCLAVAVGALCFPRPDIVLLLRVSPEIAVERKELDMPTDLYTSVGSLYTSMASAKRFKRSMVREVDCNGPVDASWEESLEALRGSGVTLIS